MLASGIKAPEFGIAQLRAGSGAAPVALVFLKVSCPVCQMALPFLDRIARSGVGLRIVEVSQDDAKATAEFNSEFGVRHVEVLLDPPPYAASKAFRITSVPSVFLIEPDGTISQTIEGFSKSEYEDLGQRAGVTVFTASDRVPAFRPG
jgi:peroxiredoxin